MNRVLTPLAEYPVRPAMSRGESMVGYIRRCYWENGHELPSKLNVTLSDLYRGHYPDKAFRLITSVWPALDLDSRTRWVTHRLDAVSSEGRRARWLRLHYSPVRYCPSCLKQDGIHRELWTWPLVVACPLHRCELVEKCHNCGRSLAWGVIQPGWICCCSAQLADAPAPPALACAVRLATTLESTQNAGAAFEQYLAQSEIYDFLTWAYQVRGQLSRRSPFSLGPRRFTLPKARVHNAPTAWEESLFMADGGYGQRRLRALERWNFRGQHTTFVGLQPDGPLAVAIKALSDLPRNRYTEKLLDEAEALQRQYSIGVRLCPDVYFNPRLSERERHNRLAAFARYWQSLAMQISPLEENDRLIAGEQFYYGWSRLDLIVQILNQIVDASMARAGITHFSSLIARWHVSSALRQLTEPDEILNELCSYLAGLPGSELGFVLDLMLHDGRTRPC